MTAFLPDRGQAPVELEASTFALIPRCPEPLRADDHWATKGECESRPELAQHSARAVSFEVSGWLVAALVFGALVTSGCTRSFASEDEVAQSQLKPLSSRTSSTEQPVAYSHAVHIEAGLDCQRCHAGAFENKRAGLPPLATCISCHRRTIPDHPEVQKLLAAWETETPIQWVKVNVLPDQAMVQFHHAAHTLAGVGCEQCHGDVASMAIAEPVIDVARMGWCVQCHRDNGASDDCLACHY